MALAFGDDDANDVHRVSSLKSARVSRTANRPWPFGRVQWNLAFGHLRQARISNPCFCTMLSNLSAMPLGCFSPDSHCFTVEALVFK